MAFRPHRWSCPLDWPQISARIRFPTAGSHGVACCRHGGQPQGRTVHCLPDGRWLDPAIDTWRDAHGQPAEWPDIVDDSRVRTTRVFLAAAHLEQDPGNNRPRNLKAPCQRCHLRLDQPHHRARGRITLLLRRAAGDLFPGACSRRRLAALEPVPGYRGARERPPDRTA